MFGWLRPLTPLRPLRPFWRPFDVDPFYSAPRWAHALHELVRELERKVHRMARTLDELLVVVREESTQVDSLIQLTAGLKSRLDEVLGGTLTPEQQAAVDAIFDEVAAERQKVVDAVNANTPAATPPTPPPDTPPPG